MNISSKLWTEEDDESFSFFYVVFSTVILYNIAVHDMRSFPVKNVHHLQSQGLAAHTGPFCFAFSSTVLGQASRRWRRCAGLSVYVSVRVCAHFILL